eukprot:1579327-Alexandrium_andersonii.AAC.1
MESLCALSRVRFCLTNGPRFDRQVNHTARGALKVPPYFDESLGDLRIVANFHPPKNKCAQKKGGRRKTAGFNVGAHARDRRR